MAVGKKKKNKIKMIHKFSKIWNRSFVEDEPDWALHFIHKSSPPDCTLRTWTNRFNCLLSRQIWMHMYACNSSVDQWTKSQWSMLIMHLHIINLFPAWCATVLVPRSSPGWFLKWRPSTSKSGEGPGTSCPYFSQHSGKGFIRPHSIKGTLWQIE